MHSGIAIEAIDGLARFADPEHARRGLRWMMARNENKSTPSIADTAFMLKTVARHYLKLPPAQYDEIAEIARRLAMPPTRGLTAKNRAGLRQFDDVATVTRLLRLPDRLRARADALGPTYRAALLSEVALALDIVMVCPIRRKNLAGLHRERNLRRFGDGRVFLVFEPGEVKNERLIEFELPARILAMIDRHVALRAPLLCPHGTPWLFPRRDGLMAMDRSGFGGKISEIVRKEVGAEMNLHLFRHLAAKFWLDRHPGNYEALRRLLGHAELSSTLNAYAGFEAGTATRLFAELIDGRRHTP